MYWTIQDVIYLWEYEWEVLHLKLSKCNSHLSFSKQAIQSLTNPTATSRKCEGFPSSQIPKPTAKASWIWLWGCVCLLIKGSSKGQDHVLVTFLPFLLQNDRNKSLGRGQSSLPIKWFIDPAAPSLRTMYFITVNLRTRYNFLSQGAAFKSRHLDSPATTLRNNRSQPHPCFLLLACTYTRTVKFQTKYKLHKLNYWCLQMLNSPAYSTLLSSFPPVRRCSIFFLICFCSKIRKIGVFDLDLQFRVRIGELLVSY